MEPTQPYTATRLVYLTMPNESKAKIVPICRQCDSVAGQFPQSIKVIPVKNGGIHISLGQFLARDTAHTEQIGPAIEAAFRTEKPFYVSPSKPHVTIFDGEGNRTLDPDDADSARDFVTCTWEPTRLTELNRKVRTIVEGLGGQMCRDEFIPHTTLTKVYPEHTANDIPPNLWPTLGQIGPVKLFPKYAHVAACTTRPQVAPATPLTVAGSATTSTTTTTFAGKRPHEPERGTCTAGTHPIPPPAKKIQREEKSWTPPAQPVHNFGPGSTGMGMQTPYYVFSATSTPYMGMQTPYYVFSSTSTPYFVYR